jgi:hypothetical protein
MVERIRQNVTAFCERCVVCRRAKTQPQMAATLYPLLALPIPWHAVGLDYLTHLHVSNGGARRRRSGGGPGGGCARMPVGPYLYLHAVGVGNPVAVRGLAR